MEHDECLTYQQHNQILFLLTLLIEVPYLSIKFQAKHIKELLSTAECFFIDIIRTWYNVYKIAQKLSIHKL